MGLYYLAMIITIINDCRDANAVGRQSVRNTALFDRPTAFIGVQSDLEAAGNLIDALDAAEDKGGVVLVNVAPRNGKAKKWGNGTPFGYFWYRKTLVVASIDGYTLSLVKKLKVVNFVYVLDIPIALDVLIKNGKMSDASKNYIVNSQFRSYDFLPLISNYLMEHDDAPNTSMDIREIQDAPPAVWWIDSFGNCKTTMLPEEVGAVPGNGGVATKFGKFNFYTRLADVPDKESAVIVGSSGLGEKRFLELVIQGDSIAKQLNISPRDVVF